MPEDQKQLVVGSVKKAPVTEIAYCPHLDIYHYRRADGQEYLFDSFHLKAAMEGYLRHGDETSADFMATLTGFARQFPHQVVAFNEEGKLDLRELLEKKIANDEDVAGPAAPVDAKPK
jgi:hypothetical protein